MTKSTWRSLAGLAAGVAVVTGVLAWWGGWTVPLVLALIIFMVLGHEFGHYITARRAGMHVTDFFVGFGPVLWSTKRGETRYGIRALLLGGYVKVPGMMWNAPLEEGVEEARTYRSASYPRKVLFASAGSLMHIVFALLLAAGSLLFVAQPSATRYAVNGFEQWDGYRVTAAQAAGVRVGDRIVAVDGRRGLTIDAFITLVHQDHGHVLDLTVERRGRLVNLSLRPVNGATLRSGGVALATPSHPAWFVGMSLIELDGRPSVGTAVGQSFTLVGDTMRQAVAAIGHVFSPGEYASLLHQVVNAQAASSPVNQATRPVSIVGIVRVAGQAAASNRAAFLQILITLNIFVGVLNMLPMLPLDGGYVAIATYERLRQGRRRARYHADVNKLAPLIYLFVGALAVLFLCTLYLDIAHPISNPF